jgi:zinc D-Ala-D-Ala carboxypeptidase
MIDEALSKHFTLAELTRSDLAARLGIDNTPPPAIVEVLRITAGRLERVREILSEKAGREIPVHVSSGYRCEALERVLCERTYEKWCVKSSLFPSRASWKMYFATKQHPKGRAADIEAPAFGTPLELCRALEAQRQVLELDQLIYEFRAWAHVGWSESVPRHQVLTISASGTLPGLNA